MVELATKKAMKKKDKITRSKTMVIRPKLKDSLADDLAQTNGKGYKK